MYIIGLTLFSLHYLLQLMRKGLDTREKNLERERIERRQEKTMAGNRTNSQHLTNKIFSSNLLPSSLSTFFIFVYRWTLPFFPQGNNDALSLAMSISWRYFFSILCDT
jgi:hypothetical protein